ncbi:MAG: sugar transferase [Bacillota bacterium]|nr:sugar transferase [Bacillota bacterium]
MYEEKTLTEKEKKIYEKNHKFYWRMKRTLDIILSLLAIACLSPILLFLYIIIFIDDPHGSPIFIQIRVGRHGEEFRMYKFRTMIMGADKMLDQLKEQNEKDGPVFKIKRDPRVTRVGRVLRRISLDELPQLFNIVKGDMAIVGPRPPLPQEVEQYSDYEKLRLAVTPGLTCTWQVQPQRDDISFDEWMDLDVDYIAKRSLLHDIKLILTTIRSVIKGEGS